MKMTRIQFLRIKTQASIALISIGVIGLLSTVCAYSSYIPAGDTSYQWLWCGWVSIIFTVCVLLAVGLSAKGVHFFYHSVIWGLILMGGIEAVWGLRQIYGFATSNHSLYAVTGSFYNPGPYSGYLALVFPVCLYEWLRLNAIKQRTWKESVGYYLSFGVLLLLVCVLPAGMSRSAWLASIFSGVFVCSVHYPWRNWLKKAWKEYHGKAVVALLLLSVILITGGIGIYHLIACFLDYSHKLMLLFTFVIGSVGVWLVRNNAYDACREWSQCKMLYSIQAYGKAKEEYGRLYPLLNGRPRFLFEYGRCLHNLKEYNASNRILQEAERISCDPMILNVIGKNYKALKRYEEAEHWFLRSTHRLPGRIYPYYLLAKLYAEPDFRKPDKLEQMVEIVLTKEPKIQSSAIREMRDEVKKLISR